MHLHYCSTPVHVKCVAQMVKCLSAMEKTWVRSLGWEEPLEKEMAAHSSSLSWKIPWAEEPGRLQTRVAKSWTPVSDYYSHFSGVLELILHRGQGVHIK